jgi:hypothetical protein
MGTIKIPLKIISLDGEGCHVFLKAKINGVNARLLLDTGASRTVFDTDKIKKFILSEPEQNRHYKAVGLGTSNMDNFTVVLDRFSVGALKLKNYTALLLDLSHANQYYAVLDKKEIDGILGGDILWKTKSRIDYKKSVLILTV